MKNKYEVTLGSFANFAYVSSYLQFAIKRFCMETRLSNSLKTANATKLIKTIPESTCKVVLGTCNLVAPMWSVSSLKAIMF